MSFIKFKGVDSRKFGITARLPIILTAERGIKTIEIPGRPEPVIQLEDVRKTIQIPVTMGIPDMRRIREISAWLQGSGDLILSDDMTKKYHAYINRGIDPERLSRSFAQAPIVFTALPFRYSVYNPFNEYEIDLNEDEPTAEIDIYCAGTASCEPLIFVKLAGKLKITVNDTEEPFTVTAVKRLVGDIFEYVEQDIYIDCAARQAYILNDDGKKEVVTNQTYGKFPVLNHEDNIIGLELINEILPAHRSCKVFKCQNNERWY